MNFTRLSSSGAGSGSKEPLALEQRRLEQERALFRRLVIAFFDLIETRECVNRLLGSHGSEKVEPNDVVVRSALLASLVVSYGRMFVETRRKSDALATLPQRAVRRLTKEQRALHDRLLELRNREFAHSDADVAQVKVTAMPDFRGGVLSPSSWSLRRDRVTTRDLELLSGILQSLYEYIHDEMLRLHPQLAPHGDF